MFTLNLAGFQALERQKRLTQEEKHAHSGLHREIQTLADSCEQLSKFKSKCEQELQVKVQHIAHLEAQLRSSKAAHGDTNKVTYLDNLTIMF